MVYGEGKTASPVQIYDSKINVVPKLKYNVKVEVLRNDWRLRGLEYRSNGLSSPLR